MHRTDKQNESQCGIVVKSVGLGFGGYGLKTSKIHETYLSVST